MSASPPPIDPEAFNLRSHRMAAIAAAERAMAAIIGHLGESPEAQMAQLRLRETIFWAREAAEAAFARSQPPLPRRRGG